MQVLEGFQEDIWIRHRFRVLCEGNFAKVE